MTHVIVFLEPMTGQKQSKRGASSINDASSCKWSKHTTNSDDKQAMNDPEADIFDHSQAGSDGGEDTNSEHPDNSEDLADKAPEDFSLQDLVDMHNKGTPIHKIIKPCGTGGSTFNIHNCMGLTEDGSWYNDIVVSRAIIMGIYMHICVFTLTPLHSGCNPPLDRKISRHPHLFQFSRQFVWHTLSRSQGTLLSCETGNHTG
jgi:hypothetical protein